MKVTETGGLMERESIQQIEIDEYEIEELLNGHEVTEEIYTGGAFDKQRVIEVRSPETSDVYNDLLYEISYLDSKTNSRLKLDDVNIYDDVMEALFELLAALGDMNKRIENGENPIGVYRDVLASYEVQKCIDTYDYYNLMRKEYR